MISSSPPLLARLLFRLVPLGRRRPEVEEDLSELFAARCSQKGARYAQRRYYSDVLSLWRSAVRRSQPAPGGTTGWSSFAVGRDLAYAARLFRRTPAVVGLTVVGLGLAIGVSTAVFTLLNTVLFRPTGIDDPSSVVRVMRAYQHGISTSWPYADYVQLRDGSAHVTLEACLRDGAALTERPGVDSGEPVHGLFVSGGYLATLSGRTTIGRLLTRDDDVIGAAPALVVSHRFWTTRFQADPTILGRTLWLNGAAFTVVGVSERRFSGSTERPSFWAPLSSYHVVFGGPPFDRAARTHVDIVGRIPAGQARDAAESDVSGVAVGIANPLTDAEDAPLTGVRFMAIDGLSMPGRKHMVALVVSIVFVVIGLVLLLACVNVANLLLASAWARQREMSVRLALGASRARIVRQLFTESLALGLVSGAIGLVFTVWLVPLLAVMARAPMEFDFAPDLNVYLFLTTISIIAGLGAGLAPARSALRDEFAYSLKGTGRVDCPARSHRLRSTLVGVQAAASLVLLVLATLLTRGMVRATQVDVGFNADRLMTVSPAFGRGTYDAVRAKAYWDAATERVRTLPGVSAVSLTSFPPFGGAHRVNIIKRGGAEYSIYHDDTQADYFAAVGLRVLRGRTYTAAEIADRADVAVISESLAKDYFPGEDPIGQSLARITRDSQSTIIGVVSSAITARLREMSSAVIYRPIGDLRAARLIVRTEGRPEAVMSPVREAVQAVDPRLRLTIVTVADGLQSELEEPRSLATLAGALATFALALAIVGIYGVTAFVAGLRTQEISIRLALGATKRDVWRLLLGSSLRPVFIGLAAGLALAVLGSRIFAGVLYGIPTTDPVAFGAAILVLLASATIAIAFPTRHATNLEPASILRQL
jgi:predicted permease